MKQAGNRSAAQLFNHPAFSDITIKQVYNGSTREYFAHKAVLCLESSYFLNMLKGGFEEADDSVIELHDDDPDHFEFLLKYMYTYQYDTNAIVKLAMNDHKKRVTIPIGIYAVADKYDVPILYEPITADVRSQLNTDTFELLETAISAHYISIASVGGLMGKMFTGIILKGQRKFTETPKYRELVTSNPVFGADVALALAYDTINIRCSACSGDYILRSDTSKKKNKAVVYCNLCQAVNNIKLKA